MKTKSSKRPVLVLYGLNIKSMIARIISLMLLALLGSCNHCEFFGDNDLGNNFSLLEGDRKEDRIIVYCTGYSTGCCRAGIPVIPSRADSVTGYIEKAKANKKWIIAVALTDKSKSYWIIDKDFEVDLRNCEKVDCDSLIQTHVIGPLDSLKFKSKNKELDINLSF